MSFCVKVTLLSILQIQRWKSLNGSPFYLFLIRLFFLDTYIAHFNFNSCINKIMRTKIQRLIYQNHTRHNSCYFPAIEISILDSFFIKSPAVATTHEIFGQSIRAFGSFIPHPATAFRSIGSLIRKKKKKRGMVKRGRKRRERNGQKKKYPKKVS